MPIQSRYTWDQWNTTSATTTSNNTWTDWNATSTTTSSYNNTSATNVWIRWNDGTTTTATMTDCWVQWVDEHGYTRRAQVAGNQGYNTNHYVAPPETEEQREARRQADAAREAERQQANETAEQLLMAVLTEEQQDDLIEKGHFFVTGSKSGKKYRIKRGYAGNVFLDEGSRPRKYCAHGRDSLPVADHMLMQLLTLSHDEERFLAVANVS